MTDTYELFDLEELVNPEDIYCESQWHYDPPGRGNYHADGGPFWYVNFTKQCNCGFLGVEIRCDKWAHMVMDNPPEMLYSCSCGGRYRAVVLGKVTDG